MPPTSPCPCFRYDMSCFRALIASWSRQFLSKTASIATLTTLNLRLTTLRGGVAPLAWSAYLPEKVSRYYPHPPALARRHRRALENEDVVNCCAFVSCPFCPPFFFYSLLVRVFDHLSRSCLSRQSAVPTSQGEATHTSCVVCHARRSGCWFLFFFHLHVCTLN